jgi:hypothetical protein
MMPGESVIVLRVPCRGGTIGGVADTRAPSVVYRAAPTGVVQTMTMPL